MFRFTRGDLAQKSNAQLSALFNLATQRVAPAEKPETQASEAGALLALLKAEMRRRLEP